MWVSSIQYRFTSTYITHHKMFNNRSAYTNTVPCIDWRNSAPYITVTFLSVQYITIMLCIVRFCTTIESEYSTALDNSQQFFVLYTVTVTYSSTEHHNNPSASVDQLYNTTDLYYRHWDSYKSFLVTVGLRKTWYCYNYVHGVAVNSIAGTWYQNGWHFVSQYNSFPVRRLCNLKQ